MSTEPRTKLIIESILFTADKPLSVKDISVCLPDVANSEIRNAIRELQTEYDQMDRSFALKEVANGFQFRTTATYAPYILRMMNKSPTRLSKAAMETLAIIAYKQPILRQEIERLRGVDAGGLLRTLMEKDLIRIVGRKDLPGRPLIYGTTRRFLEVFELKDLESLPKLKEINEFGTDEQGTEMPGKDATSGEVSDEALDEESDDSSDEPSDATGTGKSPGMTADDLTGIPDPEPDEMSGEVLDHTTEDMEDEEPYDEEDPR